MMPLPIMLSQSSAAKKDSERRRHGRLQCDDVQTSLGDVVDISASGACVLSKAWRAPPVDSVLSLTLTHPALTINIQARVVGVQKQGFRRHSLRLEYVGPESAELVAQMARTVMQYAALSNRRPGK